MCPIHYVGIPIYLQRQEFPNPSSNQYDTYSEADLNWLIASIASLSDSDYEALIIIDLPESIPTELLMCHSRPIRRSFNR